MSKNAKKQLKAIIEKHKNDIPIRSKQIQLTKPVCIMVPLLKLDDCLTFAIQENVITDIDANAIVEYMKNLSIETGYWDLHWEDIKEENGMESEQVKGFEAFYELFKEHEIRDKNNFPHPYLHFDVGVYI